MNEEEDGDIDCSFFKRHEFDLETEGVMMTNTVPQFATVARLSVSVGCTVEGKEKEPLNKLDLGEDYAVETIARGYHAYLRKDGAEGRRFDHFIHQAPVYFGVDEPATMNRPVKLKRLRKLERRGMLLGAILDMVPSFFHSCWMLIPYSRKTKTNRSQA